MASRWASVGACEKAGETVITTTAVVRQAKVDGLYVILKIPIR
jgi:hypothetical protein